MLRNIFSDEENPKYWKDKVGSFPNGIPRFDDKASAIEFMKEMGNIPSNPDERHLCHSISLLITWDQIERFIFPKILKYYSAPISETHCVKQSYPNNRYLNTIEFPDSQPVAEYLESRLNLPIHSSVSLHSTLNTLNYLFHHMKFGIFVMIRQGKIVVFCPFANKNYRNNWREIQRQYNVNDEKNKLGIKIDSPDGTLASYFAAKEREHYHENYLPDTSEWWTNGNIICNVLNDSSEEAVKYWGDHFFLQMRDLIAETCRTREIPDCDFFLNKRDYPQLKFSPTMSSPVEPYGFVFDRDDRKEEEDIPLSRHCYQSYAPILSFYSSHRFADIPFPPTEDWEAATGKVFPSSLSVSSSEEVSCRDLFTPSNLAKFERPWQDKVPTAFFRGTATGGGVTIDTNQRLHLAYLSAQWNSKTSNVSNVSNVASSKDSSSSVPLLDAKLVGWNPRDKKIAKTPMTYIHKKEFPFRCNKKENFVPIYQQSAYKYVLYVEGHCAACRYGFMMQLGSVILKVESQCVADSMWYFPLLQPYVDHVPVKADLSDLQQQIEWCRNNDDKCQQIVQRAKELYMRLISRDGVLDYMQAIFVKIAQRTIHLPEASQLLRPYSTANIPGFDIDFSEMNTDSSKQQTKSKSLRDKDDHGGTAAAGNTPKLTSLMTSYMSNGLQKKAMKPPLVLKRNSDQDECRFCYWANKEGKVCDSCLANAKLEALEPQTSVLKTDSASEDAKQLVEDRKKRRREQQLLEAKKRRLGE